MLCHLHQVVRGRPQNRFRNMRWQVQIFTVTVTYKLHTILVNCMAIPGVYYPENIEHIEPKKTWLSGWGFRGSVTPTCMGLPLDQRKRSHARLVKRWATEMMTQVTSCMGNCVVGDIPGVQYFGLILYLIIFTQHPSVPVRLCPIPSKKHPPIKAVGSRS
jgi:hypothetical protein